MRYFERPVRVAARRGRAAGRACDDLRACAAIAELNDAFRRSFAGGQVFVTAGINSLPSDVQAAITARVRSFDEFDADNDPYGEHDFGSFVHAGEKICWKIDLYDRNQEFYSPDPTDPAKTNRVLTIPPRRGVLIFTSEPGSQGSGSRSSVPRAYRYGEGMPYRQEVVSPSDVLLPSAQSPN
jgi:hypothetical protein